MRFHCTIIIQRECRKNVNQNCPVENYMNMNIHHVEFGPIERLFITREKEQKNRVTVIETIR